MLEEWASRPSPWRSRSSKLDLAVTIVLFVLLAVAACVAFFLQAAIAAASQYGCDWETSTRVCRPWVGWAPSLGEGVLLLVVFVGGVIAARWVRHRSPRGWAVALVTALVMGMVALGTSAVVAPVVG
ncbi:hypothetical protein BIU97_03955 [Curtobacterium sp. MCBA15_009]|uniref:hypothetical protein n=1 Tax=Curtobacterium sp. MCBA15_009 TaxID=1898737 RepID=UPI0008DDB50C|nr:hypothetical protein [Curtobacterium sp. MCBA15_009]OII13079.1 hypothetical protein BIU97_03955 [Curtobacterium sp. MCBA15_009]